MDSTNDTFNLLSLTTDIVSAYVSNNTIDTNDLQKIIHQVYSTMTNLAAGVTSVSMDRPDPAVAIKKSVTPDYIVCLEDGKKLKMLKRHLKSAYNMSPAQYRERWGLPADYPMVAPNYAVQRSQLARTIGLGTRGGRRKESHRLQNVG